MLSVCGHSRRRWVADRTRTGSGSGTPKTAVCEILTQDLGVKRVVAKFIPRLLLPEQKDHRAAVADDLIQTATNEPDFLQRVTARDELWVWGCDLERKAHCPSGGHLVLHAGRRCSKINTVLAVFFDWEGIVRHEYAPPGQTVNKERHLSVFQRQRGAVRRKWLQLRATGDGQLLHGDAPTCASYLGRSFVFVCFLGKISNHEDDSAPLQPRFGTL